MILFSLTLQDDEHSSGSRNARSAATHPIRCGENVTEGGWVGEGY